MKELNEGSAGEKTLRRKIAHKKKYSDRGVYSKRARLRNRMNTKGDRGGDTGDELLGTASKHPNRLKKDISGPRGKLPENKSMNNFYERARELVKEIEETNSLDEWADSSRDLIRTMSDNLNKFKEGPAFTYAIPHDKKNQSSPADGADGGEGGGGWPPADISGEEWEGKGWPMSPKGKKSLPGPGAPSKNG